MVKDPFGAVRIAATRHCRKDPMPVGTVVIRQDKIVHQRGKPRKILSRYVKARMDGPPWKRWILYSRWWWEKNRGPVPPGKLVLHKDGNLLNDAPGNLMLGTPGTKLALAHENKEWSRRQHARAAAACGERNRLVARIRRMQKPLKSCWYPVLDNLGVILLVPFRKRKQLLAWFGGDVSCISRNGRGRKIHALEDRMAIRAVHGCDLRTGILSTYAMIDPEIQAKHRISDDPDENDRVMRLLSETAIWKRAAEGAALAPRARMSML